MNIILHKGMEQVIPQLDTWLQNGSAYSLRELPEADMEQELEKADLVMLGPGLHNPVRLVQDINKLDGLVSILLLCLPEQFQRVKQSLQFSPFIGKNSSCISLTPGLDLQLVIKNAVNRTRQKRSFSRINLKQPVAASIREKRVQVENLGTFLDQAPIGAVLLDGKENIKAINQKARQIFHLDLGGPVLLRDMLPGLSLQQLSMNDTATGKNVEIRGLYLELQLSPVKGEDNEPLFILLINDITEKKLQERLLRESEEKFRFMAEAMPEKLWTADENGAITFFNQKWLEYTGMNLDQLKGWQWEQIIHPDDVEAAVKIYMEAIRSGENFELENRIRNRHGEYRWHLVRGMAKKNEDGKVMMWVGTDTDIQEHKAFTEELEKRVKERTIELEKSNAELEQFVYVTSHDLQEPLRKIRIYVDMLQQLSKGLGGDAEKYMQKITSTSARMSHLMKELLNFTQLNREEQFVQTDLNEILHRVIEDLELVIQQKQARIEADPLPTIKAVPVQLQQLFYNLINNSLKFQKKDVAPELTIRCAVADPEEVESLLSATPDKKYYRLVFADNGIGFDEKYASQIFNIFQRLHTRTEYSGTGIGLALCKKVVFNHHGHITASSEPGKGAAFTILLPEE